MLSGCPSDTLPPTSDIITTSLSLCSQLRGPVLRMVPLGVLVPWRPSVPLLSDPVCISFRVLVLGIVPILSDVISCRFCPPSCTACREPTHDTGIISSVRNCFVPWEFFQGCALVWCNTQRTPHFPARSSGISRKSNRKMGCSLRVI